MIVGLRRGMPRVSAVLGGACVVSVLYNGMVRLRHAPLAPVRELIRDDPRHGVRVMKVDAAAPCQR